MKKTVKTIKSKIPKKSEIKAHPNDGFWMLFSDIYSETQSIFCLDMSIVSHVPLAKNPKKYDLGRGNFVQELKDDLKR